MTEKNLIRVYTGATSEKRIDIIIKNYTKFIGIVDGYTDGLRYMIECEKESSHRQAAGAGKEIHGWTAGRDCIMGMTAENIAEKRCYTVKEVQEMLGISRPTVYELLKKNEFRWIQIGNKYRISKKSFDEWLDQKYDM